MDLDAPAGDAHLLDDESQEATARFDVEVVEQGGDAFCEACEPAAEAVLGRELGAALGQRVLLAGEFVAPRGDGGGPSGEFVEFEQSGLVGVEQPGALAFAGLEGAVEVLELRGDELVLVGWGAGDHGPLAGEQLSRVQQCLLDLCEDVLVEVVGADVALGAAAL